MRSHLGDYVRRQREKSGIARGQLARLLGYKNIGKGARRVLDLEAQGICEAKLWEKVQDVLGLSPAEVEQATAMDWAEYQAWLDEPVPMELVVRLIPAVYLQVKLPPDVVNGPVKAEAFACQVAKDKKRKACLAVSRRLSIWINEKGEVTSRSGPSRGRPNRPYMQVGGKRFLFAVGA